MSNNQISRQPHFEALRRTDILGDYWSARELQDALGYVEWRRFEDAIERASAAISNSGMLASDHVGGADKMIEIGKGGMRLVADYRLTKYGAYMVAMNGDPRKDEIAAAQTYFAVRTHEAEVATRALPQSYAEALRELASAVEELEAAKPAAAAWTALASGAGDYEVADAAKILANAGVQTGRQRLFAQLSAMRWIYRGSESAWRAYQSAVDSGYLREQPKPDRFHPRTGEPIPVPPQVRVTVKGLERLRQRLHVGALQAVSS